MLKLKKIKCVTGRDLRVMREGWEMSTRCAGSNNQLGPQMGGRRTVTRVHRPRPLRSFDVHVKKQQYVEFFGYASSGAVETVLGK